MISKHNIVGGGKYMHNNNRKNEKYYYTPSHFHKLFILKHKGGYMTV